MKIYNFWKSVTHEIIFPAQLAFGVFWLNLFGDRQYCKALKENIKTLPENTLGKHLWHLLDAKKIDFVPWYQPHDLKHALLGYKMEAGDEMKMQAFMFGNAGFSVFVSVVFLMVVIWTPDVWPELPYHYRVGKLTKPIADWKVEEVIHLDLEELRQGIGLYEAREKAILN